MSNNHKKRFDRDGVLNIDTGYPHRVEDCHMIDGADGLKFVNDRLQCLYRHQPRRYRPWDV